MNEMVILSTYANLIKETSTNENNKPSEVTKKLYDVTFDDKIIYSFVDKNNCFCICEADTPDTFYFFQKNQGQINQDEALKFISQYFDSFLFFLFQNKKEKLKDFYEYTAKMNADQDLIVINAYKVDEKFKELCK